MLSLGDEDAVSSAQLYLGGGCCLLGATVFGTGVLSLGHRCIWDKDAVSLVLNSGRGCCLFGADAFHHLFSLHFWSLESVFLCRPQGFVLKSIFILALPSVVGEQAN